MSDLSPETRALLSRAIEGDTSRLSPSHRARLKRGVLSAAAAGAIVTTAPNAAGATGGASLAVGSKLLAVVAVIGAIGAGGLALVRQNSAEATKVSPSRAAPSASVTAPASSVAIAPVVPVAELPTSPSASVVATAETPPPRVLSPAPRALAPTKAPVSASPVTEPASAASAAAALVPEPQSSAAPAASVVPARALREEARLLREADRATTEGDPDRALRLLDEHGARFPSGVLEPERGAERVFALCAAGRVQAAKLEGERFLSVERPARLAARVRSSCAGVADRTEGAR